MYILDRQSSSSTAIYLPPLQLKLTWTITQKITFLSQFICLTLIALLFPGTVAMEMGEWFFCWYHCIIRGHWDCLGQEIIFRVQLLGVGAECECYSTEILCMGWCDCYSVILNWTMSPADFKLRGRNISLTCLCEAAFPGCSHAHRTTKLWSLLPLVGWTVVTGCVIAPDHFELCVKHNHVYW